jgi:hypothetical protein
MFRPFVRREGVDMGETRLVDDILVVLMRQALTPILFDDHDRTAAEAARTSIVAKAKRSAAADRKALTKRTDDGLPVHSFRSLLGDLATVTRNTMAMDSHHDATFVLYPQLAPVQARAFQLLDVAVNL